MFLKGDQNALKIGNAFPDGAFLKIKWQFRCAKYQLEK